MTDYGFQSVWPNPAAEVRREAIQFWLKQAAMSESQAFERAAELVVVARDSTGTLAGVCTARRQFVSSLGFCCFLFRSFVGKQHRTRGLRPTGIIQDLIQRSYNLLNGRFQQGVDTDVLGLYLAIEIRRLAERRRELVWTDRGANIVYVGHLPPAGQARVWYFEGARLPLS